ncbi:hypothetical protein [Cutibacterium avidum]|mgnify:CR=1 FL=1|uniref:hypothetical protein n=1 Tax=Cutibacterium avidum TaxID=33010 RepID=UPI0008F5C357|nr:hypothetical protein [Cutibacterium avidum]MDK7699094.1 hypothetical protein [Cutibacterium avidum]OIJ75738.1 hypothetical protein APY06_03150 [Cutibacterium avidum]
MNLTEANRFIAALNRIAEGASQLAATIEETAWENFEDHVGMSVERPLEAVKLAQPALDDTPTSEPDQADTAPSAPEVQPEVSLEEVRALLASLSSKGLTAKVRELIVAAGADKLSSVDPSKYGELLAQAKELADGSV